MIYHLLLGGAPITDDGVIFNVNSSLLDPSEKYGSATSSCFMSTRGSGGTFGASSDGSSTTSTPGSVQGSVGGPAPTGVGANSPHDPLSPTAFTAVTL